MIGSYSTILSADPSLIQRYPSAGSTRISTGSCKAIGATALPDVAGLKLTIWFLVGSVIQNCSSWGAGSQTMPTGELLLAVKKDCEIAPVEGLISPIRFRLVSVNQMLPLESSVNWLGY